MWLPFFSGNTCEDVLYDPSPIDAAAKIRLCNFATGSDKVLDSHHQWLETLTKMALQAEHSWVDIVGYASELPYSSTDTTGGNWALSRRRCAAVEQAMERIMSDQNTNRGFTINVKMGVGDSQSEPDPTPDRNHGFFRSVVVKFFAPPQKWDVKPLRHGSTTVDATQFEFEPIEIAGAGISRFGADWLYFGIHDLQNHRRRYFAHIGGSGSASLPFLPDISFYAEHHAGAPTPFTTHPWGVVDLEEFEGPSYLGQAIGATFGTHTILGALKLLWKPKVWTDRDYHHMLEVPFSFSSGLGISGGSLGPGRVKIMGTSYKPATYSR